MCACCMVCMLLSSVWFHLSVVCVLCVYVFLCVSAVISKLRVIFVRSISFVSVLWVCLSCVLLVCLLSVCYVSLVCVGCIRCDLDVLCLWVPLVSTCACSQYGDI